MLAINSATQQIAQTIFKRYFNKRIKLILAKDNCISCIKTNLLVISINYKFSLFNQLNWGKYLVCFDNFIAPKQAQKLLTDI